MSGGHSLHKKDYALLALMAAGIGAPFVLPALSAAGAGAAAAGSEAAMTPAIGSALAEEAYGAGSLAAGAPSAMVGEAYGAAATPWSALTGALASPGKTLADFYGGSSGKLASFGKAANVAKAANGLLVGGGQQPQAAGLASSGGVQQPDAGAASFYNMHRPVNTNAQGMASLLGSMSEEEKRRLGLI